MASDAEMLAPGRILGATVLFIVGLVAVAAAVGAFFRDPLQELSAAFVGLLGGPGIAIGYLIPDAFTVPIPNDAFGWFGIEGGVPFWEVVAWGTLGSITGGCVGYLIGRRLRTARWVSRFMTGRGRALERLIRRYGVWVVAVAALTPLPYSLSAWAAGAVHMRFGTFFAVSLTRVVRVAGALYLIQLGLLTAGG
ncbi:MAG: YqaA family protein [Nannocystaceae bacterium]|nr:VTT domain-containing protein [bacterium]